MFARATVVLLIALNLGVGLWWLLRPDPAPHPAPEPPVGVPRLQLLAEATPQVRGTAAQAADAPRFLGVDRRFHGELLRAGLGPRAADIGLRLRDQSRVSELGEKPPAVNLRSAEETVDLVEAIAEGRTEDAAALVVANLYYFRKSEESASG